MARIAIAVTIAFLLGFLAGNYSATVALRADRTSAAALSRQRAGTSSQVAGLQVAGLDDKAEPETPASPDVEELLRRKLLFPVPAYDPAKITDTFREARGAGRHEAQDIMAPRGAPVVAVEDGVVKKLFQSRLGGLTVYQFDPSEQYCYYYAHLDGYASGLREGLAVRRGDRLGYVGSTGNAKTPHLHFAIFKLGPEKQWWRGTPIDPYLILTRAQPF